MTFCGARTWRLPMHVLPSGLGHEMAGVVVAAVGEGVDDLAVGDKVASFPAAEPQ